MQNGLKKDDVEFSLHALKQITMRFSAEYALRHFINFAPNETFTALLKFSQDKNYHVRRLASEASRPKLPWGVKIKSEIKKGLEILENLYFDKTRFVTRSVANHLNDISKINSSLTLETLKRWQDSQKQNPKEMDFLKNHALRTLIKKGHKETLEFLGIKHDVKIDLSEFKISKKVQMGENLEFSFALQSHENADVIVDYVIYFVSKNNKKNSKVFKLKKIFLSKNKKTFFAKKHAFKNFSTRKIYAGKHQLEIKVNGISLKKEEFVVCL